MRFVPVERAAIDYIGCAWRPGGQSKVGAEASRASVANTAKPEDRACGRRGFSLGRLGGPAHRCIFAAGR